MNHEYMRLAIETGSDGELAAIIGHPLVLTAYPETRELMLNILAANSKKAQ